jgi:hypothetical protein
MAVEESKKCQRIADMMKLEISAIYPNLPTGEKL